MAAIGLVGAVALASSIALGGCLGDSISTERTICQKANSHLEECLGPEIARGSEASECTPSNACASACIDEASCGVLSAAFLGIATEESQPFADCNLACNGVR